MTLDNLDNLVKTRQLKLKVYLDDVDPELDNSGLRSALGHWLMLDEHGYMEMAVTGNHRQAFRDALDRNSAK